MESLSPARKLMDNKDMPKKLNISPENNNQPRPQRGLTARKDGHCAAAEWGPGNHRPWAAGANPARSTKEPSIFGKRGEEAK